MRASGEVRGCTIHSCPKVPLAKYAPHGNMGQLQELARWLSLIWQLIDCAFVASHCTYNSMLLPWRKASQLALEPRLDSSHPHPFSRTYACATLAACCGLTFFPSLLYRTLGGGARFRLPSRDRTLKSTLVHLGRVRIHA